MARRLPRYFGAVVDVRQRETIYQIQARYRLQLDELERQLAAVKQAERAEIEGLLTSEQLVRLEELRSPSQVASSRSASGRAGEGDPTEPSTPSGAKGENGGADGPKEQPRVGSPT